MNRTLKATAVILLSIGVGYLIYFITVLGYSHSVDFEIHKQYMWLFKDSVKQDIDTMLVYSYVEDRDVYNNFHYQDYNIAIWEFKDLSNVSLEKVLIKTNVELDKEKVRFSSGEILNKKSDMEIAVRFGFSFSDAMNINLDTYSEMYKPTR